MLKAFVFTLDEGCVDSEGYRINNEMVFKARLVEFIWVMLLVYWGVLSLQPTWFICVVCLCCCTCFTNHGNIHCVFVGTVYITKDGGNRKKKISVEHIAQVEFYLSWHCRTHTHHLGTHTHVHIHIPSLQVTSVWVCLVNMPSLPSQVQGECGAFIRLIKGRGQICP